MLVNKCLLFLWFTTFLRIWRPNFSTLLRLWGTADTVEPVPSCGRPASPECVRLRTAFHVAAETRGKAQHPTVHQGRDRILGEASQGPKHAQELSCVSAAKAVAAGKEGGQALLGRQAGQFCGQGRARRAGWAWPRFPLWTPATVPNSGFPLWQKGRSAALHCPVGIVKPHSWWSCCKPPYWGLDSGMSSQLLQLQCAHAGEGNPVNIYSVCSTLHGISVLKRAAHDTCWFLKAI